MWSGIVFHFCRCSHNPMTACISRLHLKNTRIDENVECRSGILRDKPSVPLSRNNLRCSRWSWFSSGIFTVRWSIAAKANGLFCLCLTYLYAMWRNETVCVPFGHCYCTKNTAMKSFYCAVIDIHRHCHYSEVRLRKICGAVYQQAKCLYFCSRKDAEVAKKDGIWWIGGAGDAFVLG